MKVTNRNNVQLPMAAWIVNNDYDYISTPNYISVTSLLRPTRQIVLGRRLTESKEIDVQDLAASSLGAAMHDSIERVWTEGKYKQAMKVLGYPESMINNIVINPTSVEEGQIPVYLEQRTIKSFGGWEIGGKFDVIFDGELQDYKSTSTYSYINNSKSKDYTLQGSIYRWLNQDKVQEDFISINFYFTNWTAKDEEMYGIQRVMSKAYMLMPIAQTEAWIKSKLSEIESKLYEKFSPFGGEMDDLIMKNGGGSVDDVIDFAFKINSGTTANVERHFFDCMKFEKVNFENSMPSIYTPYEPIEINVSELIDVPSISSNSYETVVATVTGAIVGDFVQMTYPSELITLGSVVSYPIVTDNDEVSFLIYNHTGGAIDPSSGLYTFKITK